MSQLVFRQRCLHSARIKGKISKVYRDLLSDTALGAPKDKMKVETMNLKADSIAVAKLACTLRRFSCLFVLMASVLLAGCHDPEAAKLVGVWTMDKADQLAQRVTTDAGEIDASNVAKMSLHFKSGGRLETVTKLGKIDSRKTGRWRVIPSADGDNTGKTKIECSIDQIVSQHEVRWVDDATIRMNPPNMSGQKLIMKFRRSD